MYIYISLYYFYYKNDVGKYYFPGKSRTLDCIFKPLRDLTYELSRENLIQESLPLLTCSKSGDILGDSVQYATNSKSDIS